MDDEFYFPLKDDNINGNKGFYIGPEMVFGDVPDVCLKQKIQVPREGFGLACHFREGNN